MTFSRPCRDLAKVEMLSVPLARCSCTRRKVDCDHLSSSGLVVELGHARGSSCPKRTGCAMRSLKCLLATWKEEGLVELEGTDLACLTVYSLDNFPLECGG